MRIELKCHKRRQYTWKCFLENSWMESSPHKTVFQLIAWQEVMEMMNIYKYNTIFMKYTIVLSTCFGILNSPKSTCSQELLSTPRQTLPSCRPLEAKLLPLDLCAVIWASGIQRKLWRTPRLLLLQSKVARYVFEYNWNLERPHSAIKSCRYFIISFYVNALITMINVLVMYFYNVNQPRLQVLPP